MPVLLIHSVADSRAPPEAENFLIRCAYFHRSLPYIRSQYVPKKKALLVKYHPHQKR